MAGGFRVTEAPPRDGAERPFVLSCLISRSGLNTPATPTTTMPMAATNTPPENPPLTRALTDLRAGEAGRLEDADLVDADRQLLGALGLVNHSRLRLCKAGDPWIVQVRGTRIGIAEAVARRLQVVPEA